MKSNEVIIVEQGRLNYNNEYFTVTYAPVDSMKTAEYLLKFTLKEYRSDKKNKVKKLDKNVYEIRMTNGVTQDEVYIMSIRRLSLGTMETAKKAIENGIKKKKEHEQSVKDKYGI